VELAGMGELGVDQASVRSSTGLDSELWGWDFAGESEDGLDWQRHEEKSELHGG
jgi:hypothetical protein